MEPEFATARMADYDRMAREWERIGHALESDPDLAGRLGFTQRISLGWFTGRLGHAGSRYQAAAR